MKIFVKTEVIWKEIRISRNDTRNGGENVKDRNSKLLYCTLLTAKQQDVRSRL